MTMTVTWKWSGIVKTFGWLVDTCWFDRSVGQRLLKWLVMWWFTFNTWFNNLIWPCIVNAGGLPPTCKLTKWWKNATWWRKPLPFVTPHVLNPKLTNMPAKTATPLRRYATISDIRIRIYPTYPNIDALYSVRGEFCCLWLLMSNSFVVSFFRQ